MATIGEVDMEDRVHNCRLRSIFLTSSKLKERKHLQNIFRNMKDSGRVPALVRLLLQVFVLR